MKLIVNSDDYGLTKGVNYGIIEALQNGVLRSTTAMVNMPAIDHAVKLSKVNPELGVGLHLVLSAGYPLVKGHKTIVDEKGHFLKGSVLEKSEVDIEEVYREYKAQMEKFIELFGRKPTHIDGHHHTHKLPQTQAATLRLAKEYSIDYVRSLSNHPEFISTFYADKVGIEVFKHLFIERKDEKILEIMCHTAFIDVDLLHISSYNSNRVKELETLVSPEIIQWVKDEGIELTHF